MTYDIKPLDEANVVTDEDGIGTVSLEVKNFVIRRECSLLELQETFEKFRAESCDFLVKVLSMVPSELNAWYGGSRYKSAPSLCPADVPVGLKIDSEESKRLAFLDHATVVKAAIDLGEIDEAHVSGDGIRMKKGGGRFHEILWSKSQKRQRAIIRHAFDPKSDDLAALTKKFQQGSRFDFAAIEKELTRSKNVDEFLKWLARSLWSELNKKKRATNFATCWFAMYLCKEGVWFFPKVEKKAFRDLTPRLLWPMIWEIPVPEPVRKVALQIRIDNERANDAALMNNAHCEFLLRTNLYNDLYGIDEAIFFEIKGNAAASLFVENNRDHRAMSLNLFFDRLLKAIGENRDDHEELSMYFGGGGRIESSKKPFSWMMPGVTRAHRKGSLRAEMLKRWKDECPPHVSGWIGELEQAVQLSPRRSKVSLVQTLNHWVYYLLTLDEADCPMSFADIDRISHIYSPDPDTQTFLNFIQRLSINQQEKTLMSVQQSWLEVARAKGFDRELTCPIDSRDIPRASEHSRHRGLGYRTPRRSLGAEKLQLIIEENRRPDEQGRPFGFARNFCGKKSAPIYYRKVENQETGESEIVFFPGPAVYLDVLLNTGMRAHSGRWLDSGEGDEFWVDQGGLRETSNPLQIAQRGRQEGFVRLFNVHSEGCVLGMYLPVSKTGAQEVPWVDAETAEYVEMMRDWQIKYNPRSKTVTAADKMVDKTFGRDGAIPEVYPLFRDPRNLGIPPGYGTLSEYFYALLQHCERIYNERKREVLGDAHQWEPFFIDGSPKWTFHSLRVTLVSTLIEAGVSPAILQVLVGHRSIVMTYHYIAIDNAATNEKIRAGIEIRRQSVIDAADKCETSEEAERLIRNELGGAVTPLDGGHCGVDMFRAAIGDKGDREFHVFSHGICPRGECSTGGKKSGSKYMPVFREQACSRCRYRVTGPAFLNGLVLRLNQLMLEMYESFERERKLQDSRLEAKDSGSHTGRIDAMINRHRESQEELFAEWAAELSTIKKCQAAMDAQNDGQTLPVIAGMDKAEFKTRLTEGHKLTLLQSIVSDAETIHGVELEIPDHIRAQRDEFLLEIAEANDAVGLFYSLPREQRGRALHEFGKMFISHQEMIDERGATMIDEMIKGSPEVKVLVNKEIRAVIENDTVEANSRQQVLKSGTK